MFKSKKTAWLTIVALLVPTTIGLFGSSAAQAAPSTNLSTFTVNGTDVLTSNSIDLDIATLTTSATGVLSADVVAVAAETVGTTVVVAGDSGLAVGPNTLTVTVTVDWTEEVFYPYVPAHTESNPDYREAVEDDPATPGDETAPAQGEPTITYPEQPQSAISTARTASQTYTRTLNVLNNDASSVIVVNGEEVINGESTEVDWGTTTVPVVVTPTDPKATVKVNGTAVALISGVATTTATGLETGDSNTVTVLVTAPNGEYDESLITVSVLPNTDTSATITVEGIQVDDGEIVALDYGTTDPDIAVTTTDVDATVSIVGESNLISGENRVEIYVTAANGVDIQRYDLTLMVGSNDDTDAIVYVNGVARTDGDEINLPYETDSVTVSVELSDLEASYVVDGGTNLVQGDNELSVTITAADNVTEDLQLFNVLVGDPDVTLKTLKFNGTTIANEGTATTWTLENTLLLEATDSRSTIVVDGGTYVAATNKITLEPGENTVLITVTGDDGSTSADYSLTLGAYALEVDWEGNAEPVSVVANGTVSVDGLVENVSVTATAPLNGWIAEVEGNTDLAFGSNTVTVTYTSVENVEVLSTFTVFVGDADLSAEIEIGGETVVFDATGLNGTVSLEDSPASAEVVVSPTDARSTFAVTGGNALNVGPNTITVVVTGADDKTRTYTITVTVIASTETEITGKFVNGEAISEENDFTEVTAGVISIDIDTADVNATSRVTVAPTAGTFGGWATTTNGVITGSGFLTVTVVVTAEDGVTVGDAETFNILATKDFDVTSGSNPVTDTLRVGTYAKSTPATVAAWFSQGAKLNYQWLLDGELISGATTSRLLLTADHYGEAIVRPVVSHTVAGVTRSYIGQALDVSLGIIPLASVPGITGKPQLGNTLKVATKKWTADVELTISWYVDGQLSDVTGEEFVLNESNVNAGETVKARVTGELDGYETLYKESALLTVTPGTLRITEKPSIAAGANGYVVGEKITITSGKSNNLDADENIQWYRNGVALFNETDSEYEITASDVSKKLTAVVTYSAVNYSDASITLKAGAIKVGTLDQPDAANIAEEGATKLIAVLGYDNTVARSSVKYIWYRNGRAVLGQNTASYTLTAKDAGASIGVLVTATYPGYKATTTKTAVADLHQVD